MLSADKMRIQTLREQGYGAKAIMARYPQIYCKLSRVKKICNRVDQTGSATEHKAGSGRPKFTRSDTNIAGVDELICSQEGQSGQRLSTCEIAANSISVTDQSIVYCCCLNNATLLYVCLNVFECTKIARWHFYNANNFKPMFDD